MRKCGLPKLDWVRQNPETLIFLEHMQRQAAERNLYDWRNYLSSAEYQARLDQFGSGVECTNTDEDMTLTERVSILEDRISHCDESGRCSRS